MKTLITLLAFVALVCGCNPESNSNQGGTTATEITSGVQTNSRSGSGIVQTNTPDSGAPPLSNTNSSSPSQQ